MARLLVVIPLLLLACSACKKSESDPGADVVPPGQAPKLTVGMPAPPLTVSKWLKGDPVPTFEPGKVYVVEFWAIWCPPCLATMPHLSDLTKEYQSQGLKVVAFTTADERGNTPEAVAKFVAGPGKDYALTFALSETRETDDAYVQAAGIRGLPASFVVDRAGKIAFVGHPDDLDEVLPKVLNGSWRGAEDLQALKRQEVELEELLAKVERAGELAQMTVSRNPDRAAAVTYVNRQIAKAAGETLGELDSFAVKHPGRAARAMFQLNKAQLQLMAGKVDEARATSEPVLTKAAAKRNVIVLDSLFQMWVNRGLNPDRKHPEVPVQVADELLTLQGGESVPALMAAAQAHFFAGSKARGQTYGEKALTLVSDPRQRAAIQQALREFEQ